jgi:hypothetical protein
MTDTEFFYWLQGYFELSATESPLSHSQADCIVRHAGLVRALAIERRYAMPERVTDVAVLARMITEDAPATMGERCTNEIRSIVADQFQHVIDPAAGGPEVQASLHKIHSGPNGTPVYRC